MKRLLHVVGDSKFGGGSVLVLRMAEYAKSLGWEVDVLATDTIFHNALRAAGIGIVPLDVIWRDVRPWRDWRGARRLRNFLQERRYSVVHTHTSKAGFVGRWAAWRAKASAVVHTVHGFPFHEESSLLALRFYSMLERIAARWCDRIVTVSQFHRDWALHLGIGKQRQVVAIPNGIPPGRAQSSRGVSLSRQDLGLSADELMILSTGRLALQKGLDYLLEAVPLLEQRLKRRFRVIVVGDGPLRPHLEDKARALGIQRRVQFEGFRPDIENLLAACDIVALPSLWEGLSIALLEAMAAGKPVITTTIGSNREVTLDGQAAVLIPPKDPRAIADAVVKVAEDDVLTKRLSEKAREVFLESYTEDRMLRQYAEVYQELLQRH